jgi:cytochrome P450
MPNAGTASASLPPGPRLPPLLQALRRIWRYEEFRERCYARYGETFTLRIGGLPPGVLTRDRDAIRRLFTGEPLLKRHGNDLLRPFVGDHSLLVLEPAPHLERRRLVTPPFHGERVRSYAEPMQRLVSEELERVRVGQVLVVQPFAQALTLEVIMQAVLGVRDHAVRQRLARMADAFTSARSSLALMVPALAHRARWNLISRTAWRVMDEFDALLFEHIAATRADPRLHEREDILAMLVTARNEQGEGLSDRELRDEIATLIAAGNETTATAICWGAELLALNPKVLERAREGEEEYMDALVKEVLRIRPPLPIGAARHVLEPFEIGPWTITPDVAVLVDAQGLHHDPVLYPQPQRFRPERFLEQPPDAYAFLPFGGGVHRCLGAALAQLEMKVVLRELLMRFELAPVSGKLAGTVPRGPTFAPRHGGRVRIVRERSPAALIATA